MSSDVSQVITCHNDLLVLTLSSDPYVQCLFLVDEVNEAIFVVS